MPAHPQGLHGAIRIGNVAAAMTGLGDLATAALLMTNFNGVNPTKDTAASAPTLAVFMQHPAASLDLAFRRHYASAELI